VVVQKKTAVTEALVVERLIMPLRRVLVTLADTHRQKEIMALRELLKMGREALAAALVMTLMALLVRQARQEEVMAAQVVHLQLLAHL
jgi:hypothetical protein